MGFDDGVPKKDVLCLNTIEHPGRARGSAERRVQRDELRRDERVPGVPGRHDEAVGLEEGRRRGGAAREDGVEASANVVGSRERGRREGAPGETSGPQREQHGNGRSRRGVRAYRRRGRTPAAVGRGVGRRRDSSPFPGA